MKIAVVVLSVAVFVLAWYSWNLNSRLDDLEDVQQEPATVTDTSPGESNGSGLAPAGPGWNIFEVSATAGAQQYADDLQKYNQQQIDSATQDLQRQIDWLQQQQDRPLFP